MADSSGDEITVNETHNGQSVVVTGDQVLVVDLEANPTTGYSWAVAAIDDAVLRQIGETNFEPYESERIGSPGRQSLRFRATGEGDATLSLAYQRSWETTSPGRVFSIQVRTEGPFSPIVEERPTEPSPPPSPQDLGPIAVDDVPSAFNWCDVGGCTTVKDQGWCGSCWAFATIGVVESLIKLGDGVTRDVSEQYLVSCNSDGWGCGGGWRAFDYFINQIPPGETAAGAVYEADFPYTSGATGNDGPCTNQPHTHHEKLVSWGMQWGTPSSPATIKQLIYDYGPVYVSVCASGPAFNSYSGGIYLTNESSYCGGGTNHGVVLVGWDDNQGSSGVWYLRNSWGTSWGENGGYMRIGYGVSNVGSYPSYAVYGSGINQPPNPPSYPSPADGAVSQPIDTNLSWIGGDPDSGDIVTYDVYLDTNPSPSTLVCNDVTTPACDPGTLARGTHYHWRVVATDNHSESTNGPTWDFGTQTDAGPLEYSGHTIDGDGIIECGETIQMYVDLYNDGSATATGVTATISTSDSLITWPYNTSSPYSPQDIIAGGTGRNSDDFDFEVHELARDGRVVTFDLEIGTDSDVWTDSFSVTLACSVDYPTLFFPLAAKPPISNSGFESGRDGSWSESSSNGYQLIVPSSTLPDGMLPHSGDWAVWLGGAPSETSILSQEVYVPPTATTLDYWYWIGSADVCNDDYASVYFGSLALRIYNLCTSTNTGGWTYGQINITGWRNQTVDLRFVAELDGDDNNSNFFLDDVSFSTEVALPDSSASPRPVLVPIDAAVPRETR
jgi:predicted secreted protein